LRGANGPDLLRDNVAQLGAVGAQVAQGGSLPLLAEFFLAEEDAAEARVGVHEPGSRGTERAPRATTRWRPAGRGDARSRW
jgi:hypothetical protein